MRLGGDYRLLPSCPLTLMRRWQRRLLSGDEFELATLFEVLFAGESYFHAQHTMLRDETYDQWKYMDIDFDRSQMLVSSRSAFPHRA
jgi:hypothetical protein